MVGLVGVPPALRLILPATGDWLRLRAALEAAELPTDDLLLPGRCFFSFGLDGGATCYGGLEGNGPDLLLRSVLVPPSARGRGAGRAVVLALEAEATRLGATRLHLLTTTAAAFFQRLGYRLAERPAAPSSVAATTQFTSLCPSSAAYLAKRIGPGLSEEA